MIAGSCSQSRFAQTAMRRAPVYTASPANLPSVHRLARHSHLAL